jgi:hypothetical protein
VLEASDKTEEGILKRLRAVTTVVAGVFFVVIVAVIWQFAAIGHQKKLTRELKSDIEEAQSQADAERDNAKYYGSDEYKDFYAASELDKVKK